MSKLTIEARQNLEAHLAQGESPAAVAKVTGINYATCCKVRDRANLKTLRKVVSLLAAGLPDDVLLTVTNLTRAQLEAL